MLFRRTVSDEDVEKVLLALYAQQNFRSAGMARVFEIEEHLQSVGLRYGRWSLAAVLHRVISDGYAVQLTHPEAIEGEARALRLTEAGTRKIERYLDHQRKIGRIAVAAVG